MVERIKVVPNKSPNTDGVWIEVPDGTIPMGSKWLGLEAEVIDFIPANHSLVGVDTHYVQKESEEPEADIDEDEFFLGSEDREKLR